MGNLNLILFISFAAPLLMTLFICKGKARTLLLFLFFGTVVCLFCGEFNSIIKNMLPFDVKYYTSNFTPLFEEIFKALPILVYVFLFKPNRKTLLECSILVGVGFAVLENAFILGGSADSVSVINAVTRGFGAGMMHGVCTLAVGYGISFVHTKRKLFYTGTVALLAVAIIYHSIYNTLVQSTHEIVGFVLPAITFIPILTLLGKKKSGEINVPITKDETVKDLFRQNEIQANKLISLMMILLSAGLLVAWLLNMTGVFMLDRLTFTIFVAVSILSFGFAILVNQKHHGTHPKNKFYLMGTLIIVCAMLDALLSYNIVLLIVFPLLISLRYYSEKYTIGVAITSVIAFTISAAIGAWFQLGILDLNFADVAQDTLIHYGEDIYHSIENAGGFEKLKYITFYLSQSLVPKLLQYVVFSVIAYLIAKCGKEMVIRQAEISAQSSRIESELSVARTIQANMLPTNFPAFPDRDEFDVFATMTPAKEVGGDFYDFFMVDERHVAVVMADVSGKGVPAALFMAIAKAMIKDHTESGIQLDQTFSKVNNLLCESNSEGLFVTAFEGVLDLVTGEFVFVNAGHEIPYIYRNGKIFEPFKLKSGFVLAGMKDTCYKTTAVTFEPGDKLFQYTDGVTEATNDKNELYGQDRLTAVLEKNSSKTPNELLPLVRADIDAFVGEAPQFDDITMLCFEYKKKMELKI